VTVSSVATKDGSGNAKTTFNRNESIRYLGYVYNSTGASQTAYFAWSVIGPCGSITAWSGNLNTGAGSWGWNLPSTIPSSACAGTYIYRLSVTYNGATSSKSTTFTVNPGGSVTVSSVATTGGNGVAKSSFDAGETIRYYGNIHNSTGASQTAYFVWSVTGPCGSIASWSGNLGTGAGTWGWYLPSTIPSSVCSGTYTYKLSVTYNGATSSKSVNFTVNERLGPAGYTFCANEGQRCAFSGTQDVAYGANNHFNYKYSLTGGVDCNNSVFGDPVWGVSKACFIKPSPAMPDITAARNILKNNPNMTNPWKQVEDAPIKNAASQRHPTLYYATIEQFEATWAEFACRYRPGCGLADTRCNIYAGDVMRAMNVPLPRKGDLGVGAGDSQWTDPMTANARNLNEFLNGTRVSTDPANNGWRAINPTTADGLRQLIAHVEAGKPALASDTGHIAVIRPSQAGVTRWQDLRIAQAGALNFMNDRLEAGFGVGRQPQFFIRD
jgi:hypothetical protein